MASEAWFRNIVLKGPLMFGAFRTDDAFLICMLSVLPWLPGETECNICFACADDGAMWQLMTLLRFSIDWAKKRKCTIWRLTSDTTYDLGPLALRLGAKEITPRYALNL